MIMNHPKITDQHLNKKAIVYLRQSSLRQVQENMESQRLQYALKDRARAFGFSEVEVIDCDLGSSAAISAKSRDGFKALLASVTLGEVGIVMSREVSRLSRTDKDWCHLLELCQVFGTLIGDADQVYDLGTMDDQLILGIKGTLSVVELKILKSRLLLGQEEKARRGELFRIVAPGYVLDLDKKIVKDPDQRIQSAINLIFSKYRETWSGRQTHKWFHENKVTLPVNIRGDGKAKIGWQLPSHTFIRSVLNNPIYAGVYVYGRKPTTTVFSDGRLIKRCIPKANPEESRVFIRDHHEPYIGWETFEENRKMLRSNTLRLGKDESVSVIRKGNGMLSGLLRCGRCGRKIHVRYWGKSGTAARYLCSGDFPSGGKYCIGFGGATIDRRFSEVVGQVISPLGLKASLKAVEDLRSKSDGKHRLLVDQVEQLSYESRRAFEQYNEADPRNRLVAAELERRWNSKLEELEVAKKSLAKSAGQIRSLTKDEEDQILHLGERFEQVWNSPFCPIETKKKILRTVIEEIIVNLDDKSQTLHFVIHWKGGSHTEIKMQKPASGVGGKSELQDIDLIRKMADRYDNGEIARVLNKLKRKTGKGFPWSQSSVASARRSNGIETEKLGDRREDGILSLAQAANHCGVSDTTIRRLVDAKILPMTQVAPWAPWEILRSDLDQQSVSEIINRLKKTGKLDLQGDISENQRSLFE